MLCTYTYSFGNTLLYVFNRNKETTLQYRSIQNSNNEVLLNNLFEKSKRDNKNAIPYSKYFFLLNGRTDIDLFNNLFLVFSFHKIEIIYLQFTPRINKIKYID